MSVSLEHTRVEAIRGSHDPSMAPQVTLTLTHARLCRVRAGDPAARIRNDARLGQSPFRLPAPGGMPPMSGGAP